jgi:uncharacterized membrane protein
MILMMLLFVIMAYGLVVNKSRLNSAVEGTPSLITKTPAAIDILNERYARGEIDKATYLAMRREVA